MTTPTLAPMFAAIPIDPKRRCRLTAAGIEVPLGYPWDGPKPNHSRTPLNRSARSPGAVQPPGFTFRHPA